LCWKTRNKSYRANIQFFRRRPYAAYCLKIVGMKVMKKIILLLCLSVFIVFPGVADNTWRGLSVEPENRCSPYNKKEQYPYPQSVEDTIVSLMGGRVYGPYTGRYFGSDSETDIEHIVAASEGHDSGLCHRSAQERVNFATDPLNLTLAAPEVNRCGIGGKCGFDASEWMPAKNKCWFANRVVQIKQKYSLSVDTREAEALEEVLSNCDSFELIYDSSIQPRLDDVEHDEAPDVLTLYDDNRNGRITCAEARKHGIAPVMRQHAAYQYMNDRDGDGIVCE
jgi:hypothetical protein